VLCDELPTDMGLWLELLARLSATSGLAWLTATPRHQQSEIVAWFREPGHPERQTIVMTIDEAAHLSDQQRAEMRARYANNAAEAATRLYAADYAGGGLIFQTSPGVFVEDRHTADIIPVWARWIIGLDPNRGGLSESAHPAAAVLCWWDDMNRTLHVHDCLRLKNALPEVLVASILKWEQGDAPVAWGAAETQGVGGAAETYAQMFKRLGLRMLPTHATLDGGTALAPQIDLMESMLAGGKLKIGKTCRDLLEEIAMWERDESGKPIAVKDDLIAALRYAVMMAAKHSRGLDPDRPRYHGMGQRRQQRPRQAIGVEFDVFNPGSSDSERRGLNTFDSGTPRHRQARHVDDFDW
jgi:hypothetical protein